MRALKAINLKHLAGFNELGAQWMVRAVREKSKPSDPEDIRVLDTQKLIARLTARRNLVRNKDSAVFGYYNRTIREAEASLQNASGSAAAQSAATFDDLAPSGAAPRYLHPKMWLLRCSA